MLIKLIIFIAIALSAICVYMMFKQYKRQEKVRVRPIEYLKLTVSGIIAFIFDTIGVGSFPVNTALSQMLKNFKDEQLPAVNAGAQIMPGLLESIFFIQVVNVELKTLIILVAGTCIGGMVGGSVVSKLKKQSIRLAMICCFLTIITLLLGHKMHLLPIGGDAVSLYGNKLVLGFIGMFLCGMFASVGVGLFALVQAVLFLLNLSPLVAFPIMTTAGALQQPLTTMVFLRHDKIPLKKTFILSLAGCIGVLITLPIFTSLSTGTLHTMLLIVLIFNVFTIGRKYLKVRPTEKLIFKTAA